MSQQINLLPRKERKPLSIKLMLWLWGALLLSIAAYLGFGQLEIFAAQERLDALAQQQKEVKGKSPITRGERELQQQIDALKPDADYAASVLASMRSENSEAGHARILALLSTVSEDGVWLVQIGISAGGRKLSLSGNALHRDAVMRYARRLNEALADEGIQLGTLAITPAAAGAGAVTSATAAVRFTLN